MKVPSSLILTNSELLPHHLNLGRPNAGAQPRGPRSVGTRFPKNHAARVGCSGLLGPPLGNEFSDRRNQFTWDLDHCLIRVIVRSFVLRDGLLLGLVLVVREDTAHPFFVPPGWKLALFHRPPFRRRRRRYATSGLPVRSYAASLMRILRFLRQPRRAGAPSFARAAVRRQSTETHPGRWLKGREAETVTRSVLVRAASFRT